MKKNILALSLFILGWTAPLSAEVMTYQGRLKESNVPVNANRTFLFEICATETPTGCVPSPDGAKPFAVQNGLFKSTFTLPAVDLSAGPWYLRVQVEGSYLSPVEKLTFVPYSLYASTAGYSPAALQKAGDTMTGQLTSISSVTITGNGGVYGLQVSSNVSLAGALYSANGNVGIGTTAPSQKLEVSGNVRLGPSGNSDANYSITTGGQLTIYANDSGTDSLFSNLALAAGTTGSPIVTGFPAISLATRGGERMRIGPSGEVGIGTTAPSYRLHVSSGAGEAATIMAVSTGSTNIFSVDGYGVNALKFTGDGSGLTGVTGASGTDSTKVLKTGDTMSGSLLMDAGSTITVTGSDFSVGGSTFVVVNGNVGIGTTTPSGKLHIYSPGWSRLFIDSPDDSAQLVLNSGATGNFVGMVIRTGNAPRWGIGENIGTTEIPNFTIYDDAAAASRFYIDSTGNVGIGTTDPGARLDVAGSGNFSGSVTSLSSGTFKATGPGQFSVETSSGILVQAGRIQAPAIQLTNGAAPNYVLSSDAIGNATWVDPAAGGVGDGLVGNEVADAANTSLTRSGAGTTLDPYKLALNLSNANNWTAAQTFNAGLTGSVSGSASQNVLKAGDTMVGPLTLAGSTLTVTGDAFSVGGSTLVVTGGYLGLGTNAPAARLHVVSDNGYLHFGSNSSLTLNMIPATYSSVFINNNATGPLALSIDNDPKIYMTRESYVGVGTPAPSYRLHVSSGAGESGIIMAVSTGTSVVFGVKGNGEVLGGKFIGDGSALTGVSGTDDTKLPLGGGTLTGQLTLSASTLTVISAGSPVNSGVLWASTSTVTPALFVSTTGRVGIGSASPGYPLHVIARSGQVGIRLEGYDTSNDSIYIDSKNGGKPAYGYVRGSLRAYTEVDTSNRFNINVNSQDRLTVTPLGFVGINDLSPAYLLHVSTTAGETGTIMAVSTGATNIFTVDGSGVNAIRFTGDGSGLTNLPAPGGFVSKAGDTMIGQLTNTSSVTITGNGGGAYGLEVSSNISLAGALYSANGKVGIGTAIPTGKLDVRGSDTSFITALYTKNDSAGGGVFQVNNFAGTLSNAIAGDALLTNTAGHLLISPNAAAKDIKLIGGTWINPISMIIKDGGNVGIGTTAPATQLNIRGADQTYYGNLYIEDSTALAAGVGGKLGFGGIYTAGGAYTSFAAIKSGKDTAVTGESGAYLSFLTRTNGQSDAAERMRLTSAGNVGIGTTNPVEKLDVAGVIRSTAAIYPGDGLNFQNFRYLYDDPSKFATAFSSNVYILGVATATKFYGDGSGLSGVTVANGVYTTAANTFTNTATPVLIKPSAPISDIKLLDMQATGAGVTNFSVDSEGDVTTTGGMLVLKTDTASSSELTLETDNNANNVLKLAKYGSTASGSTAGGTILLANLSRVAAGATAGPLMMQVVSNNPMYFVTNDSERMRIAVGGNVGIAAPSPTGLFQVGGGSLTVLSGGNVGVGTTAPQSHLHVDDALNATLAGAANLALLVRHNTITAGGGPGIGFSSDNTASVGAKIVHLRTGSNSQGDLAFYTKTSNAVPESQKMIIKDSGNVGISTGVPEARLDVLAGGSAQTDMAQIWRNSVGIIVSSVSATGVVAGSKFVGDGSGLAGVSAIDNSKLPLGGGTLTGQLTLAGSSLTVTGDVTGARYQINGSTVLAILPGTESLGIGVNAGRTSTGNYNLFVGSAAGYSNTTGMNNSFLGISAGYWNTTANNNSFLGASAGYNNSGTDNSFMGSGAGYYNTGGTGNSFFGASAGYANNTGSQNSLLGVGAGLYNQSGSGDVILGYQAGGNGSGSVNSFSSSTVVGYQAGYLLRNGSADNILVGFKAGYSVTTGTGNIIIGYGKDTSAPGANNELNIGGVIYGNLAAGYVGVGAGVTNPGGALQVGQNGLIISTGGAIQTTGLGNGVTVGGARGNGAVDLQTNRTVVGQVASGLNSVLGGGLANTSSGNYATVAGGQSNTATQYAATVSGGWQNAAGNNYASVSGGISNTASGFASSVSGGRANTASGDNSFVGGGGMDGIGGGGPNIAQGKWSAVVGGNNNTASQIGAAVVGGEYNVAKGMNSFIGGGGINVAAGWGSVAFGANSASMADYTFAAGKAATSAVNGTFTWADSSSEGAVNNVLDQVMFKAKGGFWVSTGTVYTDPGLYMASNNRVGIGTAVPTAKLHVGGTPGVDGIRFPDGTLMTTAGVGSASNLANITDALINGDSDINQTGSVRLQTSGLDRLYVSTNGNVGIGTNTPVAMLDVNGTARLARHVVESRDSGGTMSADDFGKTITVNNASPQAIALPVGTAGSVGAQFTFVKLGTGKLTLNAGATDFIADSSMAGNIYNDAVSPAFATITLRLVTSNKWMLVGGEGAWVTQ